MMDRINEQQRKALLIIRKQAERIRELEAHTVVERSPIAIVGLACRFPGAPNARAFWDLLKDGRDAIQPVPPERWDVDSVYDADPAAPGKMYTRFGGFIERADEFDAQFFGITPREAISMDPQQRLLLEVTWEALESAGIPAQRLAGSPTGVFVGITDVDYAEIAAPELEQLDVNAGTGSAPSFAAGRISYVLGLQGPSNVVDTACSSSLVALHQACSALHNRDCDLALAGGAHLMFTPRTYVFLSRSLALSPDGRCKAFDASADGFSRGEGCGMVVLKRLADAQRDGDRVLAIIRGVAVNHDGRSGGITVPNGVAQERVISDALANAGVNPDHIDYLEAHGTGTKLGDPIELRAAGSVLGRDRNPSSPLLVGSVKTNIGHLEAAAGIAGVIKVVLAMQHELLPRHLHFREPNPHVTWDELPLKIVAEPRPWNRVSTPRLAGISSFGLSGTNAHVVIEEPPAPSDGPKTLAMPAHFLLLSAKTDEAVLELARQYRNWIADHPTASFVDICHTSAAGRSHLEERGAIVVSSTQQLCSRLDAFSRGESVAGVFRGHAEERPRIAWLFTGQGSQYPGMGRELYETQLVFRTTFDACAEAMAADLDRPLHAVVFDDHAADLNQTRYTQPALFALEMALARLWQSWSVEPDVVLGHSVGEYAAAAIAGVFSLEDGARLVARRGKLMGQLPAGGSMAAVFADAGVVAWAITGTRLSIAAYNGDHLVISGPREEVRAAIDRFERTCIRCQPLNTSHAFHSALLEPMLDEFERFAESIPFATPRRRLISNVTGQPLAMHQRLDAVAWRRHAREPVRFAQSLAALDCPVLLEIGPQPVLTGMAGRGLFSLRRGTGATEAMLTSRAQLYVQGWGPGETTGRKLDLPTYPFQRKRFWITDRAPEQTFQPAANTLEELRHSLAQILYLDPPELRTDRKFIDLGLDSVLAVEWAKHLNDKYGLNLKVTALFDHPTLDELAKHLKLKSAATPKQPSKRSTDARDIAIVGISCRYPGANNWREFWNNIRNGVDSVTEVPPGRWPAEGWFNPDPQHPETSYSRWGGFLDDVAGFDAAFFGISRVEAEYMDPQQRIFLEEAWKAIEDSGRAPSSLRGSKCAVYVGAAASDYNQQSAKAKFHRQSMTGSAASILAARIAYFLDLRGAALAVETACSSSLVAIHLACEDLRRGDNEMALAGGVMVMNSPALHVQTSKFSMMSLDGRCRTFDSRASGSVWAEGCGVVVLKTLSRAIEDGDHIYAVIKGSGVNQDGATNGITAPSAASQVDLIRSTYASFGIEPASIGLVEAHGTATPLGDPIEIEALSNAFALDSKRSCAIGSVKTNIGHAATAAGVAGLIKAALCIKYRKLAPSLHFEQPNPHIDFESTPFFVNTRPSDWQSHTNSVRRAAVSSFGFSGTNAHLVLEEFVGETPARTSSGPWNLMLSAKTPEALDALTRSYVDWLRQNPDINVADVCYTAATGRTQFECKAVYTVSSVRQAIEALNTDARTPLSVVGPPAEGRRIPIPGYAFQHDRYWNEPAPGAAAPTRSHVEDAPTVNGNGSSKRTLLNPGAVEPAAKPIAPKRTLAPLASDSAPAHHALPHPLIGRISSGQSIIETQFSLDAHPILRDHLVLDRFVVSSSCYVSSLLGTVGNPSCAISSLRYLRPMTLETGGVRDLRIELGAETNRREFKISSRSQNGWELHATGVVAALNGISRASISLSEIRQRCTRRIDGHDVYALAEKVGLTLGPSGQWIDQLWRGDREAIGRLSRPWDVTGIDAWRAHPGLLDSAFACLFTLLSKEALVPTGFESFKLLSPLTGDEIWCHAQLRPDSTGDIRLFDTTGLLAEFEGIGFISPKAEWAPEAERQNNAWSSTLQTRDSITAIVMEELAAVLGEEIDRIDPNKGFYEHGMDSVMAVELRNRLQQRLGPLQALSSTLAFDYPSVNALVKHLAQSSVDHAAGKTTESKPLPSGAIAIIGMACRFPGASDEEALWNLLDKGIDAVSEVPPERWDVDDYYDPDPDAPGRMSTRFGGFIQGIDLFDQQLFGIAPREIASMDPQHRLLLETTWEALERSCINPRGLTGTRTGVFMGISTSDYAHLLSARGDQAIDAYLGTGTAHSTGVGRVSYTFGFEGPNLAIDTACSSSLVAIHQACQSLRSGESDLALAGGVNAILVPSVSIGFSKARMLAPDGRCKSFDASADGYARGEGCGIVVLKRLADAERDGDRILAVIRGSAVNQDGASSGPTVPNGPAQERVIRDALAQASCKPKDVSYLEAHGTGTSLGDPIEIRAAAAVYGQDRDPKQPLLVGTIKTNIGHLEAAAGVAGVIKVVLAMRKKRVPRQLHFEKGNPHIPWDEMPLKVTAESVEWPQPEKLAAVSSFGFSGTNAHVVLESVAEAPVSVTSFVRRRYLLPLSASSLKGLRELAARWRCWVSSNPELDLADMCYSAAVGRAHLEERAALECDSVEGAVALLTTLEADQSAPGLYRGTARRRFTLETIPEDAETVARQYVRGADIDFAAWYGEPKPRKIALPVYPFQRKRFWFDEMPLPTISANGLLYELQWRPLPALAVHEASGEWLVAGDRNFFGDRRTIGTGTPRGTIYFVDDESIHQFPQLFRTLRAPIHIVTRGAQAVSNEDVVRPSQSMFWGIGKSLSLERPDLRGSLIDLPADADATWAAHLIGHLQAHRSEDQTALRRQGSFAARLTPLGLGKPETIAPPISGTWLITGGTGALGRRLANWLKTRGATHVVLAGRRAPASTADGCTFLAADVSSEDEVQSLIAEIDRELPPLSGIIHAAGILEEGRLGEQTSESFEAVLAPKARGAWNLHLATKDRNLDYFICVSSIASVWGSPGQSAYAAANAFLDGLAEHRRAKGLAALTVNFGPWGGGGLADKRSRAALAQQGIRTMGPTRAIAALESLLSAGRGHAIVADINWPVFSAVYQARRERPLFSELPVLTASARSIRASGTLTELNGAPPGERRKLLERHLREVVASILRLSATDLDPEMGFAGLGMDSLMAVELRKRLQETFGASVVLSTTLGFDYPTIRELAAYLLSALYPPDPVSTAEADLLRLHEATSEAELDALIEENVRALEAGHG